MAKTENLPLEELTFVRIQLQGCIAQPITLFSQIIEGNLDVRCVGDYIVQIHETNPRWQTHQNHLH